MSVFDSLSLSEQARQLANPEGSVGIAVAEWLNQNNRAGMARTIAQLGLRPGHHVLEIGFGNGRLAAEVMAQCDSVHYAGIEISPTMVEEALRYNADYVAQGRVAFHLGSANEMPFADAAFDATFSIGVIHFLDNPLPSLRELRRVMRPGGIASHGCLDKRTAPPFAVPEHGFFIRDAMEWEALFRSAGFAEIEARVVESEQIKPDGSPTKRYAIHVVARA